MKTMSRLNSNCFVCRAFRAFAFSGLGAGLCGYSALFMGVPRDEITFWAMGGALLGVVIMQQVFTGNASDKNGPES